jgi:dihydrodipicolinate synthase/N-acetylneuraminate lyase
MGAQATVAGNANVFPEVAVGLFDAWWRGDLAAARAAQERFSAIRRALKNGGDLSLFKAVLARRGVPVGSVRAPLRQAPESEVEAAMRALAAYGVLALQAQQAQVEGDVVADHHRVVERLADSGPQVTNARRQHQVCLA